MTILFDEISDNEHKMRARTSLVSRNITIVGRRTSIRLEPQMWQAIRDIAKREKCSVHDLCSLVYLRKKEATSLTAAIRVFLMLYYRAASTEQGHLIAGHGDFANMVKRARLESVFFGDDLYICDQSKVDRTLNTSYA